MDGQSQWDVCTSSSSFNEDISAWDTSGVTTMFAMFFGARVFNQGIGDWAVESVTNMASMFNNARAFNQDISNWAVHSVKAMNHMFFASLFNQDIGGWAVHSVTRMKEMFKQASAFDQDLGWCVDDDVNLDNAFYNTKCDSTYCGVMWETNTGDCDVSRTGNVMVNWKIRWAVTAWLADATAAEVAYGHISTWQTGEVTDMSFLFCAYAENVCSGQLWCSRCNTAAASFNDDISAWDTSAVTTTRSIFNQASSFNRPIGNWNIGAVTEMRYMFHYASAFDQDLGWCVDDDVDLENAFVNAPCASTSCGVTQGSCTRRNF